MERQPSPGACEPQSVKHFARLFGNGDCNRVQVVGPDLLGRPRAEDAGRQLREARRGVPQLHRRQQLRKPRLHGDGAGIAPRGVLLPLRELVGHALVGAVLQEASEQQVTGFQQL